MSAGEVSAHARGTVTRMAAGLGHPFKPGKFDASRCTVMLARYPCPFTEAEHQQDERPDGNG